MSKPMQDMTDDEIELEIQRLDAEVMATRAEMRALNAVLTTRRHASIARDKVAAMSPHERAQMQAALATMPAQSIGAPMIDSTSGVLPPGAG
jgi:hypothetical protein